MLQLRVWGLVLASDTLQQGNMCSAKCRHVICNMVLLNRCFSLAIVCLTLRITISYCSSPVTRNAVAHTIAYSGMRVRIIIRICIYLSSYPFRDFLRELTQKALLVEHPVNDVVGACTYREAVATIHWAHRTPVLAVHHAWSTRASRPPTWLAGIAM